MNVDKDCGSCNRAGASLQCSVCNRFFHAECIPARTSRSGKGVVCDKCLKSSIRPPPSESASFRSTSSALEANRLAQQKIRVKKKLNEVQFERLAGHEQSNQPMSGVETAGIIASTPPSQPTQIPRFEINGQVAPQSLSVPFAGDGRDPMSKVPHAEMCLSLREQRLRLELEALDLQEEELMLSNREEERSQRRGEETTPAEVNEGERRTRDWVSRTISIHLDGASAAEERPDQQPPDERPRGGQAEAHANGRTTWPNFPGFGVGGDGINQGNEGPFGVSGNDRIRSCILNGRVELTNYHSRSQSQVMQRFGVGTIPDLPPLTGENKFEWIEFLTALVEDTEMYGLSYQENMRRVKKCMSGNIARLFHGWTALADQLPELLQRLTRLMGSPQKLLGQAEDSLRDLPGLNSDLSNLASYSSELSYTIALLKFVGEDIKNLTLMRAVEKKLPQGLGMRWAKKKSNNPAANLQHLHEFLDEQMMYAIDANVDVMATRKSSGKNPVLTVSTAEVQPSITNVCRLGCKEDHPWSECPVFMSKSPTERKAACFANRRCYQCLIPHALGRCTAPKCSTCSGIHHDLLHVEKTVGTQDKKPELQVNKVMVVDGASDKNKSYYRMVPTTLAYRGRTESAHVLLDSCASVTLIGKRLVDKLLIEEPDHEINLSWISNKGTNIKVRHVVLSVTGADGKTHQLSGFAGPDVGEFLPPQTVSEAELRELGITAPVPPVTKVQPDILLGLDNGHLSRILEVQPAVEEGVTAVKTVLGWTLEGGRGRAESPWVLLVRDAGLNRLVKDYINNDMLPDDDDGPSSSIEDALALEMLDKKVVHIGDRYECPILWKSDHRYMPDMRRMAYKRHLGLVKKMQSNPEAMEKAQILVEHYLSAGMARLVDPSEASDPEKTCLLPVFLVTNPKKPDKVRLVWDAAAKMNGVSLNDLVMTGPDLTEPLVYVLQRFRQGPVAAIGDVKEMYLQVSVPKADRCALRFYWIMRTGEEVVVEMNGHVFGVKCSPACAQYVKNINAERFAERFPEAAQSIRKNMYVDDWVKSLWSAEQLYSMIHEVFEIMGHAGFPLHKWCTNSTELTGYLQGEETEDSVSFEDGKVLGLRWSVSEDRFRFEVNTDEFAVSVVTKRKVLSLVMSIFDPLGLIGFATVAPKLILRELWRRNVDWDDPVPVECEDNWRVWVRTLPKVAGLSFPRWYGTLNAPVEVHVFCDASERAMAAVAYVVQRAAGPDVVATLVASKCKLAKLHSRTIPRQELDAFLLATKVLKMVLTGLDLPVTATFIWTDAQDVLHWLHSTNKRYKPFVMARVNEIRNCSTEEQWRYVPSELNPADWATKIVDVKENTELWCSGPPFLREDPEWWPQWSNRFPASTDEEIHRVLLVSEVDPFLCCASRISKWRKLVRVVARVRGFCLKLRERVRRRQERSTRSQARVQAQECHISLDEVWAAEHLIKLAQRSLVQKDLRGLSPATGEDGVVRMSSRIVRKSEVPYATRFPVILPPGHVVTRLIFDHWHRLLGHACHDRLLLELRKNGYVCARMRRRMNEVVNKCNACCVRRAQVEYPLMGVLPLARIGIREKPFTFVGCDMFGPMSVTVGRRHEKRWVALFVCMTIRAVHVELVHSLSAKSFCMALDQLVVRRGVIPREIRSDNGTNFVAAAKTYECRGQRPTWIFNPPGAPHTGGAWERLVGSVKKAMMTMKTKTTPSDEELRHWLICAEGIVNSRPLTEVSVNASEELPVTPADVLYGPEATGGELIIPGSFSTMAKDREEFVAEFWRRWVAAYLPMISARPKWQRKVEPLKIGDLVMIAEGDRANWRRGIVVSTTPDSVTQQVRDLSVRTADGSVYRRHASTVAPIRVQKEQKEEPLPRTLPGQGSSVK